MWEVWFIMVGGGVGRVHVGGVVHNGGWRCREGFMWEVWFIMVGGGVGRVHVGGVVHNGGCRCREGSCGRCGS